MIDDFSLMGVIKGCISSKNISSPECRLLGRISDGEDIPEYPEFDPEKQYYFQMPKEDFSRGPTGIYQFVTLEDFLSHCTEKYKDYPLDFWEEV
jgi:hypothetical protein